MELLSQIVICRAKILSCLEEDTDLFIQVISVPDCWGSRKGLLALYRHSSIVSRANISITVVWLALLGSAFIQGLGYQFR